MHNLSCENEFYLHENEKSFQYERLTLNLVFIQRPGETRKWPKYKLEEGLLFGEGDDFFLFNGRWFYKWGAYNWCVLIYLFSLTGSTLSHLIIISQSKIRLQNCLDKLSSKCTSWTMEINLKKTKIMVFQKRAKKNAELR